VSLASQLGLSTDGTLDDLTKHHTAWVPRDHLGELVNAAVPPDFPALRLKIIRVEVYGKGAMHWNRVTSTCRSCSCLIVP
jgi:hypothetical protein